MPARASAGTRVAFFGPTTLLARELRATLEGRAFPASEIKLYDEQAEGVVSEYAGEPLLVGKPDEDLADTIDIAFMCGSAGAMDPYLDWPSRRGFVAIDLSGATASREDVPLVHTGINPDDIRDNEGKPSVIIAAPHAVSHNLATVAAAASNAGNLKRLDSLCLRPVSDLGERGVDELYSQTLGLLNFGEVPQDIFGRQVAFNIVPSSGITQSRAEAFEGRARTETARMLGPGAVDVALSSAFVPVFHGHAQFVTLSFDSPVEETVLEAALSETRGLRLVGDPDDFSAVDLAGEEGVAVMLAGRSDTGLSLWCFCDNLKGGATLNAIRIAERVADYLGEQAER